MSEKERGRGRRGWGAIVPEKWCLMEKGTSTRRLEQMEDEVVEYRQTNGVGETEQTVASDQGYEDGAQLF